MAHASCFSACAWLHIRVCISFGSYEMPRCDWLQHCNFLAGMKFSLSPCKPCGFAAGRPAIVAGPVLRVAIAESCSVCRALKSVYIFCVGVCVYVCGGGGGVGGWVCLRTCVYVIAREHFVSVGICWCTHERVRAHARVCVCIVITRVYVPTHSLH